VGCGAVWVLWEPTVLRNVGSYKIHIPQDGILHYFSSFCVSTLCGCLTNRPVHLSAFPEMFFCVTYSPIWFFHFHLGRFPFSFITTTSLVFYLISFLRNLIISFISLRLEVFASQLYLSLCFLFTHSWFLLPYILNALFHLSLFLSLNSFLILMPDEVDF
jgi:hypothetical protein